MTLQTPTTPKKVAILISGSGSNLQAIIDDQLANPELYQIVLVVSNRPDAYGLQRAQKAKIPTAIIDHTQFADRLSFDMEVQKLLDQAKVDLVVLAGFMRILTQEFTQHFLGKMLNIHPSLLPKYTGLHTHRRALEAKDEKHGLSIHFVTPELDGGPVVLQASVAIEADDTEATLQDKVHQLEHIAYPLVVRWFCANQLQFIDNHAVYQQQPLPSPLQLEEIA